jgi:hypothetical protein
MTSKTLILATALVLAPMALNAQSANATANSQSQAQVRTPRARIDAAMQAAAKARIPASLLQSKVAEGEAKHVPQDRIATAVETRLSSLTRAQETMKRADVESATAGELSVTADAIDAGVSQSALIKVYRNAPEERREIAVAVLADIVRLGQSSETAFARVNAALSSTAALANLHAEIASQLQLGGLSSTLDATSIVRIK